jgi:hypothetical protein
MIVPQSTNPPKTAATWQVLLCFLLVGLFLYNPFLASHGESGNLALGHPASHRATVGSSELEQFSHRDGVMAPLPDLDVVQVFVDLTARTVPTTLHAADYDEITPRQTGFSSSLWFRPPPAV